MFSASRPCSPVCSWIELTHSYFKYSGGSSAKALQHSINIFCFPAFQGINILVLEWGFSFHQSQYLSFHSLGSLDPFQPCQTEIPSCRAEILNLCIVTPLANLYLQKYLYYKYLYLYYSYITIHNSSRIILMK